MEHLIRPRPAVLGKFNIFLMNKNSIENVLGLKQNCSTVLCFKDCIVNTVSHGMLYLFVFLQIFNLLLQFTVLETQIQQPQLDLVLEGRKPQLNRQLDFHLQVNNHIFFTTLFGSPMSNEQTLALPNVM